MTDWIKIIKTDQPKNEKEFIALLDICESEFDTTFGLWDIKKYKNGVITLHIATGGWSDNEEVVFAMERNIYIWHGWIKSVVGGAYWLKWNMKTYYPAEPVSKEAK